MIANLLLSLAGTVAHKLGLVRALGAWRANSLYHRVRTAGLPCLPTCLSPLLVHVYYYATH